MNDAQYRSLLDLYMTADPWPLEQSDRDILSELMNKEAEERGYEGWIHAYHYLEMEQGEGS